MQGDWRSVGLVLGHLRAVVRDPGHVWPSGLDDVSCEPRLLKAF